MISDATGPAALEGLGGDVSQSFGHGQWRARWRRKDDERSIHGLLPGLGCLGGKAAAFLAAALRSATCLAAATAASRPGESGIDALRRIAVQFTGPSGGGGRWRDDDDVRQWRCAFSLLQSSPSQTLPCPSSHSEPAPWSSHRQRQSNFLMARDRTLLLSFIPPPCLTCSVAMDFARARRKSEAAGT